MIFSNTVRRFSVASPPRLRLLSLVSCALCAVPYFRFLRVHFTLLFLDGFQGEVTYLVPFIVLVVKKHKINNVATGSRIGSNTGVKNTYQGKLKIYIILSTGKVLKIRS